MPPTAAVVLLPIEILEFGPPSFLPSLPPLPPIPGSLEKKEVAAYGLALALY
jgi:hypothetical protein